MRFASLGTDALLPATSTVDAESVREPTQEPGGLAPRLVPLAKIRSRHAHATTSSKMEHLWRLP